MEPFPSCQMVVWQFITFFEPATAEVPSMLIPIGSHFLKVSVWSLAMPCDGPITIQLSRTALSHLSGKLAGTKHILSYSRILLLVSTKTWEFDPSCRLVLSYFVQKTIRIEVQKQTLQKWIRYGLWVRNISFVIRVSDDYKSEDDEKFRNLRSFKESKSLYPQVLQTNSLQLCMNNC